MHLTEGQFLTAEVAPVEELRGQQAEASSLMRIVLEKFQAYRNAPSHGFSLWTHSPSSTPPYARLPHVREPSALADAVAPFLLIDIARKQDLLETNDVITRLEKILAVMEADRQAA